ncbi:MAG: FHA domain-containing protein [Deltaproteobacteria bacterium]|nr:MAG: FHA domain-containing protein [Deltaproteobacteria bacterium]
MTSERDRGDARTRSTKVHEVGRAAAGVVRGFALEGVDGPSAGLAFQAGGARVTIGANPSCDVVLDDPTVSRFHCEIAIDGGRARVRDLGSRNGTIVDGVGVVDAFLKTGSTLRLGRSALRFRFLGTTVQLPLSERTSLGELAGESAAMRAVFAVLERAAATDATVLLEGETGTGKSAAARTLHALGPRRDRPLVTIDCGAIPAGLLESELFGHERGAFTGAVAPRAGAFEEADGGTVFLDEIGELPLELQPKLLGVLENRALRRVGGNAPRPVDVRVVAATNRDLRAEVNAGRFREDLYFRLAVIKLALPPLRSRLEDLPLLARGLLEALGATPDQLARFTAPAFVASLRHNAWPGNVRELRNYLEQCLVFDDAVPPGADIDVASAAVAGEPGALAVDTSLPLAEARKRAIEAFERAYVAQLLREHGGKVAAAAAAAGVDRTYLYKLLRRYR